MRNVIVYSFDNSLEKLIKRKKIIPYQLGPGDKLQRGKWYYDLYYSTLYKVTEVKYKTGGILDYAITKSDEGYNSYISTPPSPYEDYQIDYDRNGLSEDIIINSEKSYTGAEIRYWFFMNDITCFDPKYKYFWTYVDTYSKNRVSDKQKYFLKAELKDDVYTHCRVVKDTGKLKVITDKELSEYNEYMAKQKEKDMYNTRKYHEDLMDEQTPKEKVE